MAVPLTDLLRVGALTPLFPASREPIHLSTPSFTILLLVSGQNGTYSPSQKELTIAYNQGRYVAQVTKDLVAGRASRR